MKLYSSRAWCPMPALLTPSAPGAHDALHRCPMLLATLLPAGALPRDLGKKKKATALLKLRKKQLEVRSATR